MSRSDVRPWRYAALLTLIVFVVASSLPVWTAWYFGPWEGTGELASFWTMLASIPGAAEQVSARSLILKFYGYEAGKLVGLIAVSLAVGRWLGGRSRGQA